MLSHPAEMSFSAVKKKTSLLYHIYIIFYIHTTPVRQLTTNEVVLQLIYYSLVT